MIVPAHGAGFMAAEVIVVVVMIMLVRVMLVRLFSAAK